MFIQSESEGDTDHRLSGTKNDPEVVTQGSGHFHTRFLLKLLEIFSSLIMVCLNLREFLR